MHTKQMPLGGRADGRTRTADQLITNQLLYQLSYTGVELRIRTICQRQLQDVFPKRLQR